MKEVKAKKGCDDAVQSLVNHCTSLDDPPRSPTPPSILFPRLLLNQRTCPILRIAHRGNRLKGKALADTYICTQREVLFVLGSWGPSASPMGGIVIPRSGGLDGMISRADFTDQKAIVQPDSNTCHFQSAKSHYIALDDVLSAIELNKDIVTGMYRLSSSHSSSTRSHSRRAAIRLGPVAAYPSSRISACKPGVPLAIKGSVRQCLKAFSAPSCPYCLYWEAAAQF